MYTPRDFEVEGTETVLRHDRHTDCGTVHEPYVIETRTGSVDSEQVIPF